VFRTFKKVWMPLRLVVVIALGAYATVRIRDLFGVTPVAVAGDEKGDDAAAFNPKHIEEVSAAIAREMFHALHSRRPTAEIVA
jgi:hypothetical protein